MYLFSRKKMIYFSFTSRLLQQQMQQQQLSHHQHSSSASQRGGSASHGDPQGVSLHHRLSSSSSDHHRGGPGETTDENTNGSFGSFSSPGSPRCLSPAPVSTTSESSRTPSPGHHVNHHTTSLHLNLSNSLPHHQEQSLNLSHRPDPLASILHRERHARA